MKIQIAIAIITILTFLALSYSILGHYLNDWCILILFLILIYYLGQLVCQALIYPGSFKIYLRITQNSYATQQANYAQMNLKLIRDIVNNNLLSNHQKHQLANCLTWLDIQVLIFQRMENLSLEQIQYKNGITNLTTLINQPIREQLKSNIKIESDIQERIIKLINSVITLLTIQSKEMGLFASVKRWVSLELLGGLEQMRQIILLKSNSKRITLQNGSAKIDCLYIVNAQGNNSQTVLFCNPNGGYYEYMYFDSNWCKFYEQHQYNVILWNYRSYGASKGSCSPVNFLSDAQFIVNYFKTTYNPTKFGVHGYSLGGSVAIAIAQKLSLDFLIADRTYASLGQVASKWAGPKIRFLFNLLTNWDELNYLQYWNYGGQKLILQDPKDEILPYEAQLSTSIAKEWFTKQQQTGRLALLLDKDSKDFDQYFYNCILSQKSLEKLSTILKKLCNLIQVVQQSEEQNETEYEDENVQLNKVNINRANIQKYEQFLFRIVDCFSHLRYKKIPLLELIIDESQIDGKLMSFFACSFSFGIEEFSEQYKIFTNKIGQIQSEFVDLFPELGTLFDYIDTIVQKMWEGNNVELTQVGSTQLGQLITLKCGHNCNLSEQEEDQVSRWLQEI